MVEAITLKNLTLNKTYVINMTTSDSYVLDSVDWGQVEATHSSVTSVAQYGSSILMTSYGTREITITGWVLGDGTEVDMATKKSQLNAFVNPQHVIELTYNDQYCIDFQSSSSVIYSTKSKENNDVICKFTIVGLCAYPLFKDVSTTALLAAKTSSDFKFPLTIPKDLLTDGVNFGPAIAKSGTFYINNQGQIPIGFVIYIKASGGTIKGPYIKNNVSGAVLEFPTLTINDGSTLMINTRLGERCALLDGSNVLYTLSDTSTWLEVPLGVANYTLSASDVEKQEYIVGEVYYNNRYLEVEQCY